VCCALLCKHFLLIFCTTASASLWITRILFWPVYYTAETSDYFQINNCEMFSTVDCVKCHVAFLKWSSSVFWIWLLWSMFCLQPISSVLHSFCHMLGCYTSSCCTPILFLSFWVLPPMRHSRIITRGPPTSKYAQFIFFYAAFKLSLLYQECHHLGPCLSNWSSPFLHV